MEGFRVLEEIEMNTKLLFHPSLNLLQKRKKINITDLMFVPG